MAKQTATNGKQPPATPALRVFVVDDQGKELETRSLDPGYANPAVLPLVGDFYKCEDDSLWVVARRIFEYAHDSDARSGTWVTLHCRPDQDQ